MEPTCKVRVLFEYEAEQDDELTLKVGDVITNVKKEEGGWWEGELNGKKGMFPDNFVQEIKEEPVETKKTEHKKEHHKEHNRQSHHGAHISALQGKLGKSLEKAGAPAPIRQRDDAGEKRNKRAKVAFSYAAENEDEISLEPGSTVEIIKEEEEGWYLGVCNGKKGMFPSNFVEMIEDETPTETKEPPKEHKPPPPTPPEESPAEAEPEPAKPKKMPMGVGLGNIFSGGPIKLRPTGAAIGNKKPEQKVIGAEVEKKEDIPKKADTHRPPSQPPPTLPPRTAKPVPSKPGQTTPNLKTSTGSQVERARVIFSYAAENDDELTLEDGDVVTILDKDLEDSGWWKGELKGKVGVFPDNFVELLPQEEVKPKKPPPPVAPASNKPDLPPLTSTSKTKTEHHHHHHHEKPAVAKKEDKPAPALPSKKPLLPPPISKKPAKPVPDTKLLAQTDDHKVRESKDSAKEKEKPAVTVSAVSNKDMFDGVASTESLTHLTASRPKGPANKRPPSVFKKEMSPPAENHTEKEAEKSVSKKPSVVHEEPVKEHKPSRPASTYLKAHQTQEPATAAASSASTEAIGELRQQLQQLKEHTVSRQSYDELRKELHKLRDEFSHYKSSSDKKIKMLISDIDEEKKARLTMQVELDRLKKLVD